MKKVLTFILIVGLVFSLGIPTKSSYAQEPKNNSSPVVSSFPQLKPEEKISPDLLNSVANTNLNYLVYLWDQVNVDQVAQEAQAKAIARGTPKSDLKLVARAAVYHALKEKAQYTQAPLIELLQNKGLPFESFWITNCIAVTSDKATLLELASRPEVRRIEPVRERQLLGTIEPSSDNHINAVEWSVAMVGAPQVWSLGFTGQNVVVSNVDTGVDWTHPALQRKWRAYDPSNPSVPNPSLLPYSWFDAVNNNNTAPYDDYGHGTHTMGTIVGSDPDNTNQIGVAPDATWIAAKGFNSAGQGTDTDLLECAQWILAPGGNPAMAPDVCSNSWGGGAGLDEWYRPSVQAWKAAGIVPVFAAGNDGPGAGTVSEPGNYPETMCMGAIDQNRTLANFSSRGPSPYPAPYDLKPDLSAPGVNVRSSLPGGSYGLGSGTSMATPHGAGAAALLLSIDPTLTPTDVIELLKGTADPLTDSTYPNSPNYGYGYGLVNAYNAALQLVEAGTVRGRVLTSGDDLEPPTAQHTPPPYAFAGFPIPISVHAQDNVAIVSVELYARPVGYPNFVYIPLNRTSGDYRDGIYTGNIPSYLVLPDSTVEYYIRVNDYGNNMITLPPTGTFQVPVQAGLLPGYFENFDSASAPIGWIVSGDVWEWGAPSAPKSAHSPPNVYATNLTGNYPNNANAWLIMPPLDLRNTSKARLVFWHWYQLETSWDYGYVATSTNGVNFYVQKSYTGSADPQWRQDMINLSSICGGIGYVAFILTSDYSVTYPGWVIDDVYLAGPDSTPPGAPLNLTAQAVPTGITLQWNPPSDLDLDYFKVYRSTTTGTGYTLTATVAWTGSPTYTFLDNSPHPGTNYYVVTAVDLGGNEGPYSNEASASGPIITPIYFNDFETEDTSWTHGGTNDCWQWGTPTSGPNEAHSGTKLWATNLTGNYPNNSSCWLKSPAIAIPNTVDSVYLDFWQWYQIETNYDKGYVEISPDGSTWTTLATYSSSTIHPWENPTFNITSYKGQTVYLRFRFTSDSSVNYPGWYIDDFRIIGVSTPTTLLTNSLEPNLEPVSPEKGKPAPPAQVLVRLAPSSQPLSSDLSGEITALPLSAYVTILETGATAQTNPATGEYSIMHQAGTFHIQASSYAYYSQTDTVVINPDETTVKNFLLQPIPHATITGHVIDHQTADPIANAEIYVVEDPHIPSVFTGPDGSYSLEVLAPENPTSYTLHVSAASYYPTEVTVEVNANQTTTKEIELRPFIGYGAELGYDDGTAENAWAYYVGGNGWAVRMTPQAGAALIAKVKFMFWTTDWPSPGGTAFKWAIWDSSGPNGAPGKMVAGPFDAQGKRDGTWTEIDCRDLGIVVTGDFYVLYIQGADYPNCLGLATDEDSPFNGRSWEYYGGAWTPVTPDYGNFMIRASVLYPVEVPVITSPLDNFFTNVPTLTIQGLSAPNVEIDLFHDGTFTASVNTNPDGSFAFSDVALHDDLNEFYVWASVSGRHTDPSEVLHVTLDQVAPTLSVTFPAEGYKTNRDAVMVTGSATDIYFDRLEVNGSVATTSPGNFNYFQLLGPTDGTYPITVTAFDLAGNSTTVVRNVIRDTVPPQLSNLVPATNINVKPGDTVNVAFDSEPGLSSACFLVAFPSGTQVQSWIPMVESSPGHYTGTYVVPQGFAANGAEVRFRATDVAGNTTEASAPGKLFAPYTKLTVNFSIPNSQPYTGHFTVKLLEPGTSNVLYTFNVDVLTSDGSFVIQDFASGTYDVWVKEAQCLAKKFTSQVLQGEVTLNAGNLELGDINNDNVINIQDFSILAGSYGKSQGQSGFDARADLNHDNNVNISDFSILAGNYGKFGPN